MGVWGIRRCKGYIIIIRRVLVLQIQVRMLVLEIRGWQDIQLEAVKVEDRDRNLLKAEAMTIVEQQPPRVKPKKSWKNPGKQSLTDLS